MSTEDTQTSDTWQLRQANQESSEDSDAEIHSPRAGASPSFEKRHFGVPQYIQRMDSQPQHNPSQGGPSHSGPMNESAELARENEELRTLISQLQEQMASLSSTQTHEQPAAHSVPSGIVHTTQTDLHDWILRQQLKKHAIPKFVGSIDHEAVLSWTEAVTHFSLLAGLDNNATITAAWTAVAPEVLVWFRAMLETDYKYKFVAAAVDYPFAWQEIKEKFVHRYSPAFAVESVWNSLESLKRGSGAIALQEFNTKFLELARLAGRNRQNTLRGDRLYTIYVKKMTARERDILSAIAISAHRSHKVITLDDAMTVTDDQAVTHGLASSNIGTANIASVTPVFTSSSHLTAPAPMDLSAISAQPAPGMRRDRNVCSRCGGRGHWSASCGTKPDWRAGDPVSGVRGRGSGGRGPRTFRGRFRPGQGGLHVIEDSMDDGAAENNDAYSSNDGTGGLQVLSKN